MNHELYNYKKLNKIIENRNSDYRIITANLERERGRIVAELDASS